MIWTNDEPVEWCILTHKQLETHRCIINTVATAALVLKQQAISTNSADLIVIAMEHFDNKHNIFLVRNTKKM